MKRIHLLIALLACAGFMSAQDAVPSVPQSEAQATAAAPSHKFGYLSYNEVMLAMPEYTQAIKSLEELKNTYDQEMVRAEQDFTKKFTEFLDGQKSFPENIMLKRQKELQLRWLHRVEPVLIVRKHPMNLRGKAVPQLFPQKAVCAHQTTSV